VGGPSAGMMFALGIVDKLTPGSATGGAFVAGTGTIADDGSVGPIGGIQQKLVAARRAGARYFLAPAGNCAEAKGAVPKGLQVVKVAKLHESVQALAAIKAGHTSDLPHC
jgi:Lon-like protease